MLSTNILIYRKTIDFWISFELNNAMKPFPLREFIFISFIFWSILINYLLMMWIWKVDRITLRINTHPNKKKTHLFHFINEKKGIQPNRQKLFESDVKSIGISFLYFFSSFAFILAFGLKNARTQKEIKIHKRASIS